VADEGRVKRKIKINNKFKIYFKNEVRVWALCAHTDFACVLGLDFAFDLPSPVHRLDLSATSGGVRRGLFEHVDAQRIVRVPQPPDQSSNAGNLEEVVDWGSPSLGYLSWRSKKGNQLPGCPRRSWC